MDAIQQKDDLQINNKNVIVVSTSSSNSMGNAIDNASAREKDNLDMYPLLIDSFNYDIDAIVEGIALIDEDVIDEDDEEDEKCSNSNNDNSSNNNNNDNNSNKKMRRTCEHCAKAKVKCSSTTPKCDRCISHGWECTYSLQKKRGRKSLPRDQSKSSKNVYKPSKKKTLSGGTPSSNPLVIPTMRAMTPMSPTCSSISSDSDSTPTYNGSRNTSSPTTNQCLSTNATHAMIQQKSSISSHMDTPAPVVIPMPAVISEDFLLETEQKVQLMFFVLFHHLNSVDTKCYCHGAGGAFVGSPISLSLEKMTNFSRMKSLRYQQFKQQKQQNQHQFPSSNFNNTLTQDSSLPSSSALVSFPHDIADISNKISLDQMISKCEKHHCYISHDLELFASSPAPKPDLLLNCLQTGQLSDSNGLPLFGNDSFGQSCVRAMGLNCATLKICSSISQFPFIAMNKNFNDLFGYLQPELSEFLSNRMVGGLLPWAGDILALLIKSQEGVLSLIHHLAKKFNQFSHNGTGFVREGWVEGVCMAQSKARQEIPCRFRIIVRELIALGGTTSEIYIQFQRATPDVFEARINASENALKAQMNARSIAIHSAPSHVSSPSSASSSSSQDGLSPTINGIPKVVQSGLNKTFPTTSPHPQGAYQSNNGLMHQAVSYQNVHPSGSLDKYQPPVDNNNTQKQGISLVI